MAELASQDTRVDLLAVVLAVVLVVVLAPLLLRGELSAKLDWGG